MVSETSIPIRKAGDLLGGVHPNTVHRYSTQGADGVVLRTHWIGGRRYTTVSAVEEFIAASTAVKAERAVVSLPAPRRSVAAKRAAIKAKHGI